MDYQSQWGQDRYIYEIFNKQDRGTYVDIGAHDGKTLSNTYALDKVGWKGVCMEPLPDVYQQLVKNRPSAFCFPLAAYDRAVKGLEFTRVSGYAEMLSGITKEYDPRHLQRIDSEIQTQGGKKEMIKVDAVPLQLILNQLNFYHINYLTIDVEGAELKVLKGIDWGKTRVDVIDIENNYNDTKTRTFLEDFGFRYKQTLGGDDIYFHRSLC